MEWCGFAKGIWLGQFQIDMSWSKMSFYLINLKI